VKNIYETYQYFSEKIDGQISILKRKYFTGDTTIFLITKEIPLAKIIFELKLHRFYGEGKALQNRVRIYTTKPIQEFELTKLNLIRKIIFSNDTKYFNITKGNSHQNLVNQLILKLEINQSLRNLICKIQCQKISKSSYQTQIDIECLPEFLDAEALENLWDFISKWQLR